MKAYVTEYECAKCHQLMIRYDEVTVECPICGRRLHAQEAWNLYKLEDKTHSYYTEVKNKLAYC